MPKCDDDRLVAYLDGELEIAQQREIEGWLAADPEAVERLTELAQSARLLRLAFDDVIHEALPERLIAAARGEPPAQPAAQVVRLPARRAAATVGPVGGWQRWRIGLPLAASLFGLLAGAGAAYFAVDRLDAAKIAAARPALEAAAANDVWLDNAAGYFKLFASAGDGALVDVPATGDPRQALQKISQNLPQEVRLPDLKPWGLEFRGARLVVVEGRPAAQLVYTTENKAIGPLALIIGSSRQSDISPTFDRRQEVNLLYWRHQGRAYALVGHADVGYLWGIGNDVAWQLDAI